MTTTMATLRPSRTTRRLTILPLVAAPAEASSRSARSLAWSCSAPQGLSCSAVDPPPSPAGNLRSIAASNEPIKVAPQNPGGVEIPNQNKQIYERAQSGETKVVSNSEQPVDVKQAVRMGGGAVADATGSAGPAPHAGTGLNLGEPRKVRTISIKPDGTLARPEPETKVATVAPPAMTMPSATQPAPAAAAPAAGSQACCFDTARNPCRQARTGCRDANSGSGPGTAKGRVCSADRSGSPGSGCGGRYRHRRLLGPACCPRH